MHVKLGLVSALAAASTASAFSQDVYQPGMIKANEYAMRNMEEICISTRPVVMCDEDHVVKSLKTEKVGFHCLNRNTLEAQRFKQQVEENKIIPEMIQKPIHVQGRVEVPTKCIHKNELSLKEKRRREMQQMHGQRVELIETEQEFEQYQWGTEEEQLTNEEQFQKYIKNRFDVENQWQQMSSLFAKYPELTHKKLEQIVRMEEGEYKQVAEQLRELISRKQEKINFFLVPELQINLPTYFEQTVKQLYKSMKEQENLQLKEKSQTRGNLDEQENNQYKLDELVGDYQQFKHLMKRVYVYIVKEAMKLNQQAPRRLSSSPQLIRKVWEQTQKQMSKRQLQQIEDVLTQVQELLELDQTNQIIAEDLVSEQLKNSQRAARRNLLRLVIAGLNMAKNPTYQQ